MLDVSRHPFEWTATEHDWTHCNTIEATPDGNLLLSVRNQSWVLKLDYAGGQGSGKILWTLGFQGSFTWNNPDTATWFFAQHYPLIIETSGNNITKLSVIDNGNYRAGTYPTPYSRGLILNIDETKLTAEIAWQYPVSPDFFSFWAATWFGFRTKTWRYACQIRFLWARKLKSHRSRWKLQPISRRCGAWRFLPRMRIALTGFPVSTRECSGRTSAIPKAAIGGGCVRRWAECLSVSFSAQSIFDPHGDVSAASKGHFLEETATLLRAF